MPINVKGGIKSTTDYILSYPLVKRIALNPIFTAITIALIITLITWMVLWKFGVESEEEPMWKVMANAGFYSTIATVFLIFIHNDLLIKDFREKGKDTKVEALFSDIDRGISGGPMLTEIVPVRIGQI